MPLKTTEARLLESAYSYLNAPNADYSSDRIYCTHDGYTQLHPPCLNNDSEIVDRCIEYFTGQYEKPNWRKDLQKEALERWSQCQQRLDPTLCSEGLDLQFFFHLFDHYIFCAPTRALKHLVVVQWIDYNPASSSCRPEVLPSSSTHKHPRVLIKIQKANPCQPFTGQTAQHILGALLHGMAHAFILCYGCRCNSCSCQVSRSRTLGLTGHGPVWARLCQAIEAEADKVFQGLPGPWDLDCREDGVSLERERRARKGFEKKNPLARVELVRRGEQLSG